MKHAMIVKSLTLAYVVAGAATPALAAVQPTYAQLLQQSMVGIDFTSDESSGFVEWNSIPTPLAAASSAFVASPVTDGFLAASGSSAATWASATAGAVVTDISLTFAAPDPADWFQTAVAVTGWGYRFQTDRAFTFTFEFDLDISPALVPLPVAHVGWNRLPGGPGSLVAFYTPSTPVFDGVVTSPLLPAGAYIVYAQFLIDEFAFEATFPSLTGTADAAFTWSIAELPPPPGGGEGTIPEPASWVLLIGGFGLVGGALRRRRHAGASINRGCTGLIAPPP